MEKFKNKNAENINKLNEFIENNTDNITMILTSPEIYEWLKLFDDCNVKAEDIIYFKDKLVIRMDCFSSGINFVFKDSYIKFELPCICGYYKDEQHLHP